MRLFPGAIPSQRLRSRLARWFGMEDDLPSSPPTPCGSPEAILVRILSPELTPPHAEGGLLQHLRFILEHEPDHPGLQKRWLLNRIQDPAQRQALILLLDRHGQHWQEIRFDPSEYAACWSDLGSLPEALHPWGAGFADLEASCRAKVDDYIARSKHLYLRNRNGARNHALLSCRHEAPWVFPWDDDCLLTAAAWSAIRSLLSVPGLAYLAIPAAALEDPAGLLRSPDLPPSPSDWLAPQFGFSRAARLHFDPRLRDSPWIDHPLMKRLALPRRWLEAGMAACAWEEIDLAPSLDADRLAQCGWTFRLAARQVGLDAGVSNIDRRLQQQMALRQLARRCDMAQIGAALEAGALRCWTDLSRAGLLAPELERIAARARALPPGSVTDKAQMLPGTQEPSRSYRPDGAVWESLSSPRETLSCLLHDNESVPTSVDDRGRLQLMIASVCALALDGHLNGNQASFEHACRLLGTWFINPATAVLPEGFDDAAVEFRDLYPMLDAIVLLQRSGGLTGEDCRQLEEWLEGFLGWLVDTSGTLLRDYSDSPGVTWHHLLLLAISCFRGRKNVASQVMDNLPGLLVAQFRADGSPRSVAPGACLRHEDLFNLQAWTNLVVLCSTLDRDLDHFVDSNGHGLLLAFSYARRHLPAPGDSVSYRIAPVSWLDAMEAMNRRGSYGGECADLPVVTEPQSGLPPFWKLCQTQRVP